MTIRDKIVSRLNEAASKTHHQVTVHYTMKHNPTSRFSRSMTFDKKHTKEEAIQMAKDHVSKHTDVIPSEFTYRESNHNHLKPGNNFAKHTVIVRHVKPGSAMNSDEHVKFDKIDSPEKAVKDAKEQVSKKYPGTKIDDKHTLYAGARDDK